MRKLLLTFSVVTIALVSIAQKKSKIAESGVDKRLLGLDTTITRILNDWHAAGVGVAIVEKDKVIYAKGLGYRDFEKKIPVTENTLFGIGSCSKAFTATLVGMLVKDGKLDLDKPVQDYFPELKFYNDDLTFHVTTRDMMSHRTGLPRHDYAWYGSTTPRDSLLYRIRFLEPSAPLRQAWQYNNFMYIAQGALAAKLYGKSWEQLVKEKIFLPLEMTTADFSINDLQKAPDFSYGYREEKDSVIKMDFLNIDPIGPAGSINASVKEMANWVLAWINGGKYKGTEVFSDSYRNDAISSQMVMSSGMPSKELQDIQFANYGLGWMLNSYRGHFQVQHGGNIDGFSAMTAFYPSDSIGIVVLSNQNGSSVPALIRNTIADRMLGLGSRNWSRLGLDAIKKARATPNPSVTSDSVNRKPNTKPSHALADYAGIYENDGYGSIGVRVSGDTLKLDFNNSNNKLFLKHYHYDMFAMKSVDASEGFSGPKIKFIIGEDGNIEALESQIEPGVKDIRFKKLSAFSKIGQSELAKYAGNYDLAGQTIRIYVRGESTLMAHVPGQPDYELVPSQKDEFKLKIAAGYSVKFDVNDKNEVTGLKFVQPNGIFPAKKKP